MITLIDEVHEANLRLRFDYLTKDMDDWKMPIKALIPISDLNPMRAACEYFTGTELSVLEQEDTHFKVFAKGYYMMGE